MENLREAVIKMATAEQNKPLLASQIAQIEHQLRTSFPAGLHTPVHPPYAAMIFKAITELKEEGGSTEESISQYIKAKYKDLPFAHKSFLSQHLRKLCDKGFVVFTSGNCYVIHNLTTAPSGKRTHMRKHGMNRGTPPPEVFRVSEENCFENDESKEKKERKRKKASRPLVFDTEDEDEMCNAVATKLSLTREQSSIDNKGTGRTESQQRMSTRRAEQKRMLNESGDGTGINVLLQEHDIDGESLKGLVKRKKKYKMKWKANALSDHQPDEAETRQCATMPEEKSEEQNMRIDEGNKMTDQKYKQNSAILQPLVQTSFFYECKLDSHAGGSNCNWYCMDCMNGALCTFCRASHQDHNVIRIRRTMWESAVSASTVQMYIDVSEIETHIVPGRDLISLKRTTRSNRRKHFGGACLICKRFLPESFKFCSLNCKIEHDLASYMPSATT